MSQTQSIGFHTEVDHGHHPLVQSERHHETHGGSHVSPASTIPLPQYQPKLTISRHVSWQLDPIVCDTAVWIFCVDDVTTPLVIGTFGIGPYKVIIVLMKCAVISTESSVINPLNDKSIYPVHGLVCNIHVHATCAK